MPGMLNDTSFFGLIYYFHSLTAISLNPFDSTTPEKWDRQSEFSIIHFFMLL